MFTVEDRDTITRVGNIIAMIPEEPGQGYKPPKKNPTPPPSTPGGGTVVPGTSPKAPSEPISVVIPPIDVDVSGILGQLVDIINATVLPMINGVLASIQSTVSNIKDGVTDGITEGLGGIITRFNTAFTGLKTAITDAITGIKTSITNVINNFQDAITDTLAELRGSLTQVYNSISSVISGMTETIIDVVDSIIEGFKDTIRNVIGDVSDWIVELIANIKDWLNTTITNVKNWIGDIYDNISGWLADLMDQLKSTYNDTRKTIDDWFIQLSKWVNDITGIIRAWWNSLVTTITAWLQDFVEKLKQGGIEAAAQLMNLTPEQIARLSDGDITVLEDGFAQFLGVAPGVLLNSPIGQMAVAVSRFYMLVQLEFIPAQVAATTWASINLQVQSLDIGLATHAVYKGLWDIPEYLNNARLGGMSENRALTALEAARSLPTPGQVQEAFLRGEIDLKRHNELLTSYGYTTDDIQLITSLYMLIPPPSDLIRMAVREAFSPEIAERFGQYEDYPQAFTEWAEKQGINREWAERYWAAHWDLPSPSMGFEMLHRGVIDDNELKLLLRALDVMPYWRERLIQISYSPLTRVDVRRMYKLGLLTDEQVTRAYLDLGYNQTHADWLTEFTKRYSAPEDMSELEEFRSMARSTYSQAYKKHLLSRDEYSSMLAQMKYHIDDINLLISLDDYAMSQNDKLFDNDDYRKNYHKLTMAAYQEGLLNRHEIEQILTDLGYTHDEVLLELGLIDYEYQLTIRNIITDRVHEQYVSYIIDNTQAANLLDMFQFTPAEVEKLFDGWNIERSLRTRKPSMTDLRKFYTAGLMSLEQLLDELRGEGYHEKYIEMYRVTLAQLGR